MSTAVAEFDFDVDDYIHEASTSSLIDELESRGYIIEKDYDDRGFAMPDFKTTIGLKNYVLELLGLKTYSSKEEVIKEINEIF